jgi:hypothetical protein
LLDTNYADQISGDLLSSIQEWDKSGEAVPDDLLRWLRQIDQVAAFYRERRKRSPVESRGSDV